MIYQVEDTAIAHVMETMIDNGQDGGGKVPYVLICKSYWLGTQPIAAGVG